MIRIEFIGDMIYKILKENNVDFKEFYLALNNDIDGIPPDIIVGYRLVVIFSNVSNLRDKKRLIISLMSKINIDLDIFIEISALNEDKLKPAYTWDGQCINIGAHYVA